MLTTRFLRRLVPCSLAVLGVTSIVTGSPQLTGVQRATFLPESPLMFGYSGGAVAGCGDLALVGSAERDIFSPSSPGRVVLYERDGSRWERLESLIPSDGSFNDAFGTSVALGVFPDEIAVGAPQAGASGAVYLFREQAGVWTETQKIVPPEATFSFGQSVALNFGRVVVGAPFDGGMGVSAGAVYVFDSGAVQKLTPSDAAPGSLFGWSVASIQPFGERIVIGAPGQSNLATGTVYVFAKTSSGWVEEARLSPLGLNAGDDFGWSVSIHGTQVAAGAPEFMGANTGAGSAFVFDFDGQAWVERPELFAPSPVLGKAFGSSVSLANGLLAVGSAAQTEPGSLHLFEQLSGTWSHRLELAANNGVNGDAFGASVAMGGDWVLAGAPTADPNGVQQAGTAYVFELGESFATPFCFGDGAGTPCPCGNESSSGGGEGCRGNGYASRLRAFGSNGVGADDLHILGDYGFSTTVLLFSGNNALASGQGIPFGGGLLCVGGSVQRLGVRQSLLCGQAEWGPNLISQAGWNAGQTVRLQSWVRAPGSGCGSGFTFSSALELSLAP